MFTDKGISELLFAAQPLRARHLIALPLLPRSMCEILAPVTLTTLSSQSFLQFHSQ